MPSKNHHVHVSVFQGSQYDADWPPENIEEFLAWWRDKIEQIPEEFRAEARIEIEAESPFEDSSRAQIQISYWRRETDKERAEREEREAAYLSQREAEDRRAYERLKAKFEAPC